MNLKFLVDYIRNTATIAFCLIVCWYLAELVESGTQYADPVIPCIWIASVLSLFYTLLKTLAEVPK